MERASVEYAIVGAGIYGLTLADHLARAGSDVAIFDDGGYLDRTNASTGETRLLRQTIVEDPSYYSWCAYSSDYYRSLGDVGQCATKTGFALIAEPGSRFQRHHSVRDVVETAADVARKQGIEHSRLTGSELKAQYPELATDSSSSVFLEPGALTLHVDEIARLLAQRLESLGAQLHLRTRVTGIDLRSPSFANINSSNAGNWRASYVVLATGPDSVLGQVGHAAVVQQPIAWFEAKPTDSFPALVVTRQHRPLLFGFPMLDNTLGAKFVLENSVIRSGRWSNPPNSDWERRLVDQLPAAAKSIVPSVGDSIRQEWRPYVVMPGARIRTKWQSERVLQISGCSGHGYKLAAGVTRDLSAALRKSDVAAAVLR